MDDIRIEDNYLYTVNLAREFFDGVSNCNYLTRNDVIDIQKAYNYALVHHHGQFREGGEEYITHPLAVASILLSMNADKETIIAGLLHDTLEDTNATKEEIELQFGSEVLTLVDGVTKLAKMNFSSKEEREDANTRKIILGITKDIRIIIIKLADRLHNMRTLDNKKSDYKKRENAIETMELFVPLAYSLGSYRIKSELEDLSFKYLRRDDYESIKNYLETHKEEFSNDLNMMYSNIKEKLDSYGIESEAKIRTKNIYGIFKRTNSGQSYDEIHDLLSLKISLNEVDDCYRSLGYVHSLYHPFNSKFKDYICNPKTNMYRSLHTTVFGPNDRLVQVQLRTKEMTKIASLGITAYWSIKGKDARVLMQEALRKKYQFVKPLYEINKMFLDNKDFVSQVKMELLGNKVYIYTTKGDIIELPNGATPIDVAYKIHTDLGNHLYKAIVNDKEVPLNTILENDDRVKIITSPTVKGPDPKWLSLVKTTTAKRKINEFAKHA